MSIKGKGYFSIRILGMIFLFLVFLAQFISDLILIDGLMEKIIFILNVIPWLIIYLALKFEISFISSRKLFFFLFLIIYSSFMTLLLFIGLLTFSKLKYIILSCLVEIFLLTSWNFSLSIYKKRKLIFIISSIISSIFIIISVIFYLSISNWIFNIINLFLYIIGLFLIVFSEYKLKRKGFLNYI